MDCIICLLNKPKTKKSISPCKCTPFLHQKCLNKWYLIYPNECPICRINYEDIGIEYKILSNNLNYYTYIFLLFLITNICILIYLIYNIFLQIL